MTVDSRGVHGATWAYCSVALALWSCTQPSASVDVANDLGDAVSPVDVSERDTVDVMDRLREDASDSMSTDGGELCGDDQFLPPFAPGWPTFGVLQRSG